MIRLQAFFAEHREVALAFSGGVDSSFVLYCAARCGARVTPFFVKTPFQPEFELRDAQALADELGIQLVVLELDPLLLPEVERNDSRRCYYCKRQILSAIISAARARGISTLIDGNNASDDAADRPGMRAVLEMGVYSPLRECGVTKARVRALSREAGLFTWDKPAYACLATRIPTGTPITREVLIRVERAESAMAGLGFRDFRVRDMGEGARLEVTGAQMAMVLEQREQVLEALTDYEAATLDLRPRG